MRRTPLLSRLRDEDGRSLARALVVLLLVALFAGGLNAGAAAAEGRTVLCAAAASDDAGGGADAHLFADCCLAGVMPLGTALATLPPAVAAPEPVKASHPGRQPLSTAEAAFSGRASARGPPRSA
jgi:hypothetical protein